MPKVYVAENIRDNGIRILEQKGFDIDKKSPQIKLSDSEIQEIFSKYDAIVTSISIEVDETLIGKAARSLKIIANYGVGFDNIDLAAAQNKGIVVTNTPEVASESAAEHTFGLIIALNKHLLEADRFVRAGKYKSWDPNLFLSSQLWGQKIGIIGLGKIGSFVGKIAYGGFKMDILYLDHKRSEDFELSTEAQFSPLHEILKEVDILSLHVPLTPKTKHMIGREEFKTMKNSAILVNTARGPIVDEAALVWALREKEIAGAGLDVFEHEPKISTALNKMDNVILTPHMATATYETREKMSEIVAQNIIDVFEGKKPIGEITT